MESQVESHGSTARTPSTGRRVALGVAQAGLLFFLVGADCANQQLTTVFNAQLAGGAAPEVKVRVVGQAGALAPGGMAERSVFVQCPRPGGPETVTVLWYPPAGATAPLFAGLQPANPEGPPPYEFAGVPVSDIAEAGALASLVVAYAAPAPPLPIGARSVVDVFTAVTASADHYSASFEDVESTTGATPAAPAVAAPTGLRTPTVTAEAADGYSWWAATQTVSPASGQPLDQTLCQSWADLFQGGKFFVAFEFPVTTPDASDVRSVSLPLVAPAGEVWAPRIELVSTQPAPTPVFSVPLELRPDHMGFAENSLPQVAGSRWLTLAPVPPQPPVACPADLTGEWELHGDVAFDLGGAASSCADCVIQEYLCLEGSSTPPIFASAKLGAQSIYQGGGTTCVGPIPLRLVGDPPAPPFTVEKTGLARTGGNALVTFAHTLRGWLAGDTETTASFSVRSARGVTWRLYSDSGLTSPLPNPVTISGPAQLDFWAAARMPFGFRGTESVTVTATSTEPGGAATWTSDHLWSGPWAAPPPSPVLHVASSLVVTNAPVTVSGVLPDGAYRVVLVPNGTWLPGECYTGGPVAALDVVVTGGSLPPTVLWPRARYGDYDALALANGCAVEYTRIVTGDGLSAAAAVAVRSQVSRRLGR
jgi:hypothetical protein